MIYERIFYIVIISCLVACQPKQSTTSGVRWSFSADSAYSYINKQVAFGPRVPNTAAHQDCGDWLVGELYRHGAVVEEQHGTMINYAGVEQPIRNIVAHFKGRSASTILLCAHWDCRPWSDEEDDYNNRFLPVHGANDGASGVGVLLEIARQWQSLSTMEEAIGVPSIDIVFFDVEDMGTPNHYTGLQREDTWCLGSQYWATQYKNTPSESRTKYQYGILLDMVGDPSATFPREYFSTLYAGSYVEQIWRIASQLGYGRYFVNQSAYPITDDHLYVNTIAGIPCVDIIDYKPNQQTGFAEWWHTQQDDMRNINKQTLQAVGQTVMTMICSK